MGKGGVGWALGSGELTVIIGPEQTRERGSGKEDISRWGGDPVGKKGKKLW